MSVNGHMKNAITIDLEDYYHVTAFADRLSADEWASYKSRVEGNTERVLSRLAENNCHATFFVLGWVAEKYPQLIRRITEQNHEIACHSLQHRLVYQMTPAEFREDTCRAKQLLEDASGTPVRGYRAPSFSITPEIPWAFEVLAELGFTYDSSVFPVHHLNYGMPRAPRFPFRIDTASGPIVEFPLPTLEVAGVRAPIGGGAYLRLLPYRYTRWAIRFFNQEENHSACVYFHPWEIDPDQPRMQGSLTARLRHYIGLRGMEVKLVRLMQDFEFGPLGTLVEQFREAEYSAAVEV